MCGIAGFVATRPRTDAGDLLRGLQGRLHHRGPDDAGVLWGSCNGDVLTSDHVQGRAEGSFGLAHTRLSILDVSRRGWQPMGSQDSGLFVVFNGEIYNYRELRTQLIGSGYRFRSETDTEVLLAAYAEWGPDCLSRFSGMFAFALLDLNREELMLARDPYGIKPLYYSTAGSSIAFASELPALLSLPWLSKQANIDRIYEYLSSGLTDHMNSTMFADVMSLPPGSYLRCSLDAPSGSVMQRYYQTPTERHPIAYAQAVEDVRSLFLDSVRLHMRSDVPLGAALSGGIDSSAIVCAMRHIGGSDIDLRAFSYVPNDSRISEESWIDLVGQETGATIRKTGPFGADLVSDLDRLILRQGEPFSSTSVYAQYRVFELAAQSGVKVMLDGQGADEMLAGYGPHIAARIGSLISERRSGEAFDMVRGLGWSAEARSNLLRFFASRLSPYAQNQALRIRGGGPFARWLDDSWLRERTSVLDLPRSLAFETLSAALLHQFGRAGLPALLRFEDRNSMAHSVESRVPFLTPPLVDYVFRLPEEYLISPDGTRKHIFRAALRGIVPDPILDRKDKIGFITPEKEWLFQLTDWVDGVLGGEVARQLPVFRHDELISEWKSVQRGRRPFDRRVWRWLNVIRWSEIYNVRYA